MLPEIYAICIAAFIGLPPEPVPPIDMVSSLPNRSQAQSKLVSARIETTIDDPAVLGHEYVHHLAWREMLRRHGGDLSATIRGYKTAEYPFYGPRGESLACRAERECTAATGLGSPALRPANCIQVMHLR